MTSTGSHTGQPFAQVRLAEAYAARCMFSCDFFSTALLAVCLTGCAARWTNGCETASSRAPRVHQVLTGPAKGEVANRAT